MATGGHAGLRDTVDKANDSRLTFWDHLDVLRASIIRVLIAWGVVAVAWFIAMPTLFDAVIMAPCHDNFPLYGLLRRLAALAGADGEFLSRPLQVRVINIQLTAPFLIHISTAFWLSVVSTVPYLLWEVWRFIRPALYTQERRGVGRAFGMGALLFYCGVAVGYFLVWPLALRFLFTYQLSADIANQISLNSYIDNFMMLVLCMGLAFELPLVTWLLALLGLVHRSTLRQYRRHAIVAVVIAAAIITPTGDPFTLTIVAIPLYLLYELSIRLIPPAR